MANVLDTPSKLMITQSFDLKGSTSSRYISPEKQVKHVKNRGMLPTLKDLNFRQPLELHHADHTALAEQLDKDSTFLMRFNIMDYSLLIGFAETVAETAELTREEEGHEHEQKERRSSMSGRASSSLSSLDEFDAGKGGILGRKSKFQRYYGGMRSQVEREDGFTTLKNRV